MTEHTLIYRGLTYLINRADSESIWVVFADGKAILTGHEQSTKKSSAFRTAVRQAQAAIDAMLSEEQAA